jgi:hypothetical protein
LNETHQLLGVKNKLEPGVAPPSVLTIKDKTFDCLRERITFGNDQLGLEGLSKP